MVPPKEFPHLWELRFRVHLVRFQLKLVALGVHALLGGGDFHRQFRRLVHLLAARRQALRPAQPDALATLGGGEFGIPPELRGTRGVNPIRLQQHHAHVAQPLPGGRGHGALRHDALAAKAWGGGKEGVTSPLHLEPWGLQHGIQVYSDSSAEHLLFPPPLSRPTEE